MSDDKAPADVFIQWKGTDVCLDFHCYKCDTFSHFDGDFCYYLRCPTCQQVYAMPSVVSLLAVDAPEGNIEEADKSDITSAKESGWRPSTARAVVSYVGEK